MNFIVDFRMYLSSLLNGNISKAIDMRQKMNSPRRWEKNYCISALNKQSLIDDYMIGVLSGGISQNYLSKSCDTYYRQTHSLVCNYTNIYPNFYCPSSNNIHSIFDYYIVRKGHGEATQKLINARNIEFNRCLMNKNILIVGPGFTVDYDLQNLEFPQSITHICIVGFYPWLIDNICESTSIDTDSIKKIIYINGESSKNYFKELISKFEKDNNLLSQFDLIIYKSETLEALYSPNSRLMRIPKYYPFKNIGVSTHFFGNVLFDVLGAKPASISIAGISLYVGLNSYHDKYRSVFGNQAIRQLSTMTTLLHGKHEPLTAFRFIKMLIINSDIKFFLSKSLESILKLPEFHYLNLIQKG